MSELYCDFSATGYDDNALKAFLVTRRDGSQEAVLADSWGESLTDGVIRFYDRGSRIVSAIGIDVIESMRILTDGPVVFEPDHGEVAAAPA